MKSKKEMDQMMDKSLDIINEGTSQPVLFRGKVIRKVFHNNEWFYSVIDIIEAITESRRSQPYWTDLKRQIAEKEGFSQLHEKIVQLKMTAKDGKMRETDAADVETVFRIIQSVPSPKADVFKRWLAKVGYERIQETQNPGIGIKRNIAQYKASGRSDEWIKNRVKSTLTRHELTGEWAKRGIKKGAEYAALTDEISKGAFDVTTGKHKKIKNLEKKHSLRDHMNTLELAIMNLGEAASAEFSRTRDAQGFDENRGAAQDGGAVAGKARKDIESKTGKKIVSGQNFLGGSSKLEE